ncbi:transcriptional regulator, AsnC family [Quadrisphaera granulorum]|uniref:AsnC family transcriptional regulator n=1 Tax=Quadrisphaera granulorum TaxID=317664 RepID=A0A316A8H9_9ACTN|nr:Lrp/AsnC family transcriptional regulator [Quadrisphaera granulorum]PWJ53812.1 AsnC family transcriptional regulator [Quadrisphaera granulorum]SZE96569.1 transcriptional regulator, AsnC family [Quadrisphaera granulorum]
MSQIRSSTGGSPGRSARTLDDVDYGILAVLRTDGRISMAALAARVGISRANAYARVEALVAAGVITGFSARIDPARAGLAIAALVFVTVHPQTWPSFRQSVLQLPDVEYCAITTGEHDAMMLVRSTDVSAVHDFVTGVVSVLPQVRTVVSVVVLDEVARVPYLLPGDIPDRSSAQARLGMTRWTPAASGRDSMPPRP